ncbi:unnamed protein product [Didymodactylos carnosus]|uniref:Uncharacterized protein n=1 Tax=Didymodactylos carnosus TaxID=1234261 RepID=A0A815II12_9BILA|nr:unnamed protein product [Didymodactylos carnosus]CAF1369046.1 unnamed protein product [Didymodactylos carnosus]CAF3795206.1 unnamed protein product [Didymodactylos carnosus]CAF4253676.1 unnamed protein product [Didymodactylos carnosus]
MAEPQSCLDEQVLQAPSEHLDSPFQLALKYAFLIAVKILHETGHCVFNMFGRNHLGLDESACTPTGKLQREAGDSIEYQLFGFELSHDPTTRQSKMDMKIRDLLVMNPMVSRRTWFKLPISYVTKLFNKNFWKGNTEMDSLRVSPDELASWEGK